MDDLCIPYREQALQDQLQHAKESVSNMQKLHELAQNQLFELRAQSGNLIVFISILVILFSLEYVTSSFILDNLIFALCLPLCILQQFC